jgi:formate dehydrogenase subunit delta
MNPNNLIKMANQIGDFFSAMPDAEQAKQDIADHMQRFWEPRMRQNLMSHLDQHGDAQLKPMVRAALVLMKES